ncbi:MAG: 3-hydroxyacyl-CoA dehydrogenase family protein, partial [Acidobacteria bacterium]
MTIDDVRTLCVTGAGQMGSQIAMQAALHGYQVYLHDIAPEQLEKAMAGNRHQLEPRVAKGKLDAEHVAASLDRVHPTGDLEQAAGGADFVIEAVVELLDEKKNVFRQLDRLCPPHAILATNSSYIGCSELAGETGRPDKVVNMHFFFPPLVMRLVEVVRGRKTSEETVAVTAELARRIGKEPVLLKKELPGFLVNRILRAITNEAYYLLEQGVASFADIDKACELGLNHPLGPFRLSDLSGLDIGYNARMKLYRETGDDNDRPPAALARRVERGDLGRKTGRGFYDYATDPPTPT